MRIGKVAKQVGITVEAIRFYEKQAQTKIVEIDLKVVGLRRIQRNLMKLVSACPDQGPLNGCPIIGAADKRGKGNE